MQDPAPSRKANERGPKRLGHDADPAQRNAAATPAAAAMPVRSIKPHGNTKPESARANKVVESVATVASETASASAAPRAP